MANPSNEEIVRRYYETQAAHDYDSAGALRDPDWLREWPQSGERVRGSANDRAIMENWPGGRPSDLSVRVVGSEDQWVATPSNTIHRVVGSGDFWFADGTSVYPDGSTWFLSALISSGAARFIARRGTSPRRSILPRGELHGSSGWGDPRVVAAPAPDQP